MTPLDIAAYEGKKDVYDFLIEQIGADHLAEIPEFVHSSIVERLPPVIELVVDGQ